MAGEAEGRWEEREKREEREEREEEEREELMIVVL